MNDPIYESPSHKVLLSGTDLVVRDSDPVDWDAIRAADLQFFEWMFPAMESGDRVASPDTIITRQAWERMVANYEPRKTERSLLSRPRGWGGYRLGYWSLDEASMWLPKNIDVSKLQDPEYLEGLKEAIIEGMKNA